MATTWDYSTIEELEADGYKKLNESRCRGKNCGAMIIWFETPNGKRMPLNADDLQPHFSSCPDVKEFR